MVNTGGPDKDDKQNISPAVIAAGKSIVDKYSYMSSSKLPSSTIAFGVKKQVTQGPNTNAMTIPQPELILPKKDRIFTVRVEDWTRITSQINSMQSLKLDWSSAGWAFIGIAVSAVLALIAWMPASQSLENEDITNFMWITPTLIAAAASSIVIAIVVFIASNAARQLTIATAADVHHEMQKLRPEKL